MPITERNFHLKGNYAPVLEEVTVSELRVTGFLPEQLNGHFIRNGPNPKTGASPHWFLGDGMLHGVRLRDGKAEWYQNRYVNTKKLADPSTPMIRDDLTIDLTVGVSNTHIVEHNSRVLALVESSLPMEVTLDLETVGPHDFDGKLRTPMTAHPKICATTGEMLFFGYSFAEPYLTFHRASPDGTLLQSEPISVTGPTMMHDFAITDQHVLFFEYPLCFDQSIALSSPLPYRWNDDFQSRLGVMPRSVDGRDGTDADITWYDIPAGYVFHFLNGYENPGDSIAVHGAKYSDMWIEPGQFGGDAYLTQWIVDLVDHTVIEVQRDDRPIEFPRIPAEYEGIRARYGYFVGTNQLEHSLVKYDLSDYATQIHDFGPDRFPGEPVFVRADGAISEDDGYIMTFVYDRTTDTSDLVILDGRRVNGRPLVTVHLGRRVPFGFHGNWFGDVKKSKLKTNYPDSSKRSRR